MTRISRVINREIEFETLLNAQLDFSLVYIICLFLVFFFHCFTYSMCRVFDKWRLKILKISWVDVRQQKTVLLTFSKKTQNQNEEENNLVGELCTVNDTSIHRQSRWSNLRLIKGVELATSQYFEAQLRSAVTLRSDFRSLETSLSEKITSR